jgi:hypothetical protein
MQLPKMAAVDEAADMFNVMRDTRSRSVGNRRMGGSSFSREGYGGFDDRRSRGFGDFDSFSESRDSGSRYRGGTGGFRRPSSDFGRSGFGGSDRFGNFGEGDFGRRGGFRRSDNSVHWFGHFKFQQPRQL